jgi:mRNA interferase RelE/StbE
VTQWRDVWTRAALKERDRIPEKQREKILDAIAEFCATGRGNVTTIKPFVGEYRLRVGEWRVRFSLDVARAELVVLHVLIRGGAYKD